MPATSSPVGLTQVNNQCWLAVAVSKALGSFSLEFSSPVGSFLMKILCCKCMVCLIVGFPVTFMVGGNRFPIDQSGGFRGLVLLLFQASCLVCFFFQSVPACGG